MNATLQPPTPPDTANQDRLAADAALARFRADRAKLQARIDSVGMRWYGFLIAAIFAGPVLMVFAFSDYEFQRASWWWRAAGLALLGCLLYPAWVALERRTLTRDAAAQDKLSAEAGIVTLQETLEDDFFTKLVKINFKYIDQYYLQTQAQAAKSFMLSAIVAAVALAIVVNGVVLMFLGQVQPAYVSAGAGVLGEFVASIFFYLYNRTVIKMSEYHQKLVITQNISLALKIAEGLPEPQRAQAQLELIQRLTDRINEHLTSFVSSKGSV